MAVLSILGSAALVFGIWGYANATETTGKVVAVEGDTTHRDRVGPNSPRPATPWKSTSNWKASTPWPRSPPRWRAARRDDVTARLDHVRGKVQQGMSAYLREPLGRAQRGPPLPPRPRPRQSSSARSTRSKKTIHISIDSGGPPPSRRRGRLPPSRSRHTRLLEIGRWQGDRHRRRPDHCATGGRIRLAGPFCENLDRHRRHSAAEEQPAAPSGKPAEKAETAQTAAVKAIEALGGKVTRLQDGRVFVVDLSDTETGDAGLVNLGPLVDVAFLSAENTRTTDEGMRPSPPTRSTGVAFSGRNEDRRPGAGPSVRPCTAGSSVLRDTAITDRGLAHLESLKKLELLDVRRHTGHSKGS